ncbi:MAG: hypothetical protein P4L99_18390 [Chthoniobacter sp.]|nr:hypothetical protein [Chthoniobacter sp.]
MSEEPSTVETQPETEKKARERSPSYPAIGIEKAIQVATLFWNCDKRQAAFISRAATNMGYGAKSSQGLLAIAALKKYGLLEEEGTGAMRKVKLTESGIALVNPSYPDRAALIKKTALLPPIHTYLWETFVKEGASDGTIRDNLVFERKFTEEAANVLIGQFKDTVEFAKLREVDKVEQAENPATQEEKAAETMPPTILEQPKSATDEAKVDRSLKITLPTHQVRLEDKPVTRQYRVPLDDENDAEILFYGTEFKIEQLEALGDFVDYVKKQLERKAGKQ